ncbi:hypothetical protein EYC80_003393 [Monilinia laxa]|nr:hypothetical protein EYC80_003393 [Monilinia laxa]
MNLRLHPYAPEKLATTPPHTPFSYPHGLHFSAAESPSGILEQAWIMKMASEISRRQHDKTSREGFWSTSRTIPFKLSNVYNISNFSFVYHFTGVQWACLISTGQGRCWTSWEVWLNLDGLGWLGIIRVVGSRSYHDTLGEGEDEGGCCFGFYLYWDFTIPSLTDRFQRRFLELTNFFCLCHFRSERN